MNAHSLRAIVEAGHVRRCHTTPSDVTQTIAHHSWGVAVILQYILPSCSKAALLWALYHDVPEAQTGDVPATAKWASADLSTALSLLEHRIEEQLDISIDLTEDEANAVKAADLLELLLFARHRMYLGDRYFEVFEQRLMNYFVDRSTRFAPLMPRIKEFLYELA